MLHKRPLLSLSLSLSLTVAAGFPAAFAAQPPNAQSSKPATATPMQQVPASVPLDELRTFAEVFERIKTAYVEPIDDKTLLENAIKGMLSNLDPHSAYLEPEAFRDVTESTSGEFGGLGIEVGTEDGLLKVVTPIDDTPAAKAGIEAGDLIIKIDGQPTKGLSIMDAVNKMRGKPNSKITLTIVREGGTPFDLTLERAVIKTRSVRHQLLDQGYGLIRISQFQVNTGKEVEKALMQLRSDNKAQALKGLVLDLRNNPGGVLQAAVEVTDLFIDSGLIVYTKGRFPNSDLSFSATQKQYSHRVPIVVLINGGSASASEIVAGALQDHKRAVVMGTDSFGKGSVQTVLPLNNERGLKLTTALYYTPNGRSIQAQGIIPDIEVERAKVTLEQSPQGLREADLARHLGNASGAEERSSSSVKARESRPQDEDYQLAQALNLLKGLNLTSHIKK